MGVRDRPGVPRPQPEKSMAGQEKEMKHIGEMTLEELENEVL